LSVCSCSTWKFFPITARDSYYLLGGPARAGEGTGGEGSGQGGPARARGVARAGKDRAKGGHGRERTGRGEARRVHYALGSLGSH